MIDKKVKDYEQQLIEAEKKANEIKKLEMENRAALYKYIFAVSNEYAAANSLDDAARNTAINITAAHNTHSDAHFAESGYGASANTDAARGFDAALDDAFNGAIESFRTAAETQAAAEDDTRIAHDNMLRAAEDLYIAINNDETD